MTAARGIGLDIGSRTVKCLVWGHGRILSARKEINTHDPLAVCADMLAEAGHGLTIATGYGRRLLSGYHGCETVSEIKAFARGTKALQPSCRTVLDIGGQDTKGIALGERGAIEKFQMNDKCAAGTGRFLEIMATALGLSLDDFIREAGSAEQAEAINSMCTVFAESEVISMISRGLPRSAIALGIHQAVARRAVSLLEQVGIREPIVFAGGVALNPCLAREIEKQLGKPLVIPGDPQMVGALGCALLAAEKS